MKIGKSLQNILDELEELGMSDRKLLNHLKSLKCDLLAKKKEDKISAINFNKYINDLLFDGKFDIMSPSTELLHYIGKLKSTYSNEFIYYCLSQILMGDYYSQPKIHQTDDKGRSKWLMYLLSNNIDKYLIDFEESNRGYIGGEWE